MGHAEKATPLIRAEFIQLTNSVSETTYPAGTEGRIKMSGGKMYIDSGSAWGLVTSA